LRTHLTARLRRPAVAIAISSLALAGLAPAALADGGLEVTTPYPAIAVAPGSSASFDLTISSTVEGTVGLTVEGAPATWKASLHGGSFVIDGVQVAAGKTATARLDVQVPGDATAATTAIRVVATLGSRTDVLPIQVRVNADIAGDITLTTTSPTQTGASDATFNFDMTLQNGSAQDITVSAKAAGPPQWTVDAKLTGSATTASTVVKAGSSTTISVSAKPPAQTAAGDYKITVTANTGTKEVGAELGVRITGSYQTSLTTPGDLLSNKGSAGSATKQTLIVENNGTAPLTGITITGTPPTGWTVTFEPEGGKIDSVAPGGGTGQVIATITPSKDAVAGDYNMTFNMSSAEQQSASVAIRFTVETSPIWAIAGLLLIAAIFAGLFYVFRTFGRR
jgi:uncharacterized membrane protein